MFISKSRKLLTPYIFVIGAAMALSGCGRSASFRYKLSLSLDTPEGVKSGYNVVQIDYFGGSIPTDGEGHKTHGQAIYIDLGQNKRPLFALLTHIPRDQGILGDPQKMPWLEDSPIRILAKYCLNVNGIDSWIEVASQFSSCKEVYRISTDDLPDLVTFDDAKSHSNAILVDPNDLGQTLGSGISWRSMTIEVTDEPVTSGLEAKFSWMTSYDRIIPVAGMHSRLDLRNNISRFNFITVR